MDFIARFAVPHVQFLPHKYVYYRVRLNIIIIIIKYLKLSSTVRVYWHIRVISYTPHSVNVI